MSHVRILFTALWVVAIASLFSACTSPERQAAGQSLAEAFAAATEDGVVTPEEAEHMGALLQAFRDVPSVDWTTIALTVGSSAVMALTGVKLLPDRALVSPFEKKS